MTVHGHYDKDNPRFYQANNYAISLKYLAVHNLNGKPHIKVVEHFDKDGAFNGYGIERLNSLEKNASTGWYFIWAEDLGRYTALKERLQCQRR